MTTINALILTFTVFAWSRVILRFRDQQISFKSLIFWSFIWVTILATTFYQKVVINIAQAIGIGGDINFIIFVAILLLFYLVFRLFVKINRLDKDITDLTIKSAKRHKMPTREK